MLTPVDIQQKKFRFGVGYDKKDVNAFFQSVAESYEKLYRSNAELKEKVNTLTDGLQNYKLKEANLEKSIMLAEKDSEDTKSKANREAKTIELEAKNKAKTIIGDAEERLLAIQAEMAMLETQYAAYKSNFALLIKQQCELFKTNDFDMDAQIDERSLSLMIGSSPAPSNDNSFGSFNGDPQMRDESSLGGMASSGSDMDSLKNSTSAVYTSMLNENENFVDPFNPKEENGRYNPYDGRQAKGVDHKDKPAFKVASSGSVREKMERSSRQNPPKKESASTPSVDEEDELMGNTQATEEKELMGDIEEVKVSGKTLLGDGEDAADTDEFGFEFVE